MEREGEREEIAHLKRKMGMDFTKLELLTK